ncbi:hypothetical protein J2752_002627 [Halarchaeum rubridurum]|uniref:Uncharacterized protein n=1 Tax=Halarchaeum rubridurum TaxID=489911 RepID=A0A8T4GQV7_9EURY|nr:hypothetical protein [Halarchaeum rubridurum]MBP1955698.1 hypothetical protein [Halarchaeum rubridurum]
MTAEQRASDSYQFDVGKVPASVGYLEKPKGRQKEAWNAAKEIHELEQSASDALNQYSAADIAAVVEGASAARSDLRSFSRLVEVLHERDLAGVIDESLLNSVGKRADIVVHYAPLIGSVNNVLKKAEAFATAVRSSTEFVDGLSKGQRMKYIEFVLSIGCLCLEAGLMWVGAPFKLAWKGTHKLFFARSGTLFRLGRYGGDRFVAFFMSEVHWELREALFDDIITTEKAKWITTQVNGFREEPQFTAVQSDAESLTSDRPTFDISDYEGYEFAEDQTNKASDTGSEILDGVAKIIPKSVTGGGSSGKPLVLKSTMDWENTQPESDSLFSGF